jgi:transcriptional regulator with XRE-family HTH domain
LGQHPGKERLAWSIYPERLWPKDFGSFLRRIRTQQGLSQKQVAKKIGCGRIYIWRLEQGKRHPSRLFLHALGTSGLIRNTADQQFLKTLEQVIEYRWDGDVTREGVIITGLADFLLE